MNIRYLKINFLIVFVPIILLIPFGWFLTNEILNQNSSQYFFISLVAQISIFLILKKLSINSAKNIHFWIIFLIFIIGYYLKFYLYCYAFSNDELSEFFERLNPLLSDSLYSADFSIEYFKLITASLVSFTIAVYVLKPISYRVILNEDRKDLKLNKLDKYLILKKIRSFIFVTFLASLFILYLAFTYKIGIPGSEPLYLPFKLAGVINLTQKLFIPILYLLLIWLSEIFQFRKYNYLSILSYVLYAILSSIITTSRAELIFPFVVLLIYWIEIGKFKITWIKYFFILIPIIIISYTFLGIFRQISTMGVGISEVFDTELLYEIYDFGSDFSYLSATIVTLSGVILRIQGADSLIYIMDYFDKFSSTRLFEILFGEGSAYLYTVKVLNSGNLTTLFSPSLLGFFYMIFPNILMVCFLIYLYTYFWHKIYQFSYSINKFMFPATFPFLMLSLIYFTNEGTLETLIRSIIIFLIASIFIKKITNPLKQLTT